MSKNPNIPKTGVVFRVWPDGEVLALFPSLTWSEAGGKALCTSYAHIGQHGGADYAGCVKATRAAELAEYADLAAELAGVGYNLDVL